MANDEARTAPDNGIIDEETAERLGINACRACAEAIVEYLGETQHNAVAGANTIMLALAMHLVRTEARPGRADNGARLVSTALLSLMARERAEALSGAAPAGNG